MKLHGNQIKNIKAFLYYYFWIFSTMSLLCLQMLIYIQPMSELSRDIKSGFSTSIISEELQISSKNIDISNCMMYNRELLLKLSWGISWVTLMSQNVHKYCHVAQAFGEWLKFSLDCVHCFLCSSSGFVIFPSLLFLCCCCCFLVLNVNFLKKNPELLGVRHHIHLMGEKRTFYQQNSIKGYQREYIRFNLDHINQFYISSFSSNSLDL